MSAKTEKEFGSVDDFKQPSAIEDCEGSIDAFDNKSFVITDAEPYTFNYEGETIKGMKVVIDGKKYYTSRKVIVKQLEDMQKGFKKGVRFNVEMKKPVIDGKQKRYFMLVDA